MTRFATSQLIDAFADERTREEATRHIRALIDKIVVKPNAEGDDLEIDLHGALAAILLLALDDSASVNTQKRAVSRVRRAETTPGFRKSNQRSAQKRGLPLTSVKHVSQEPRAFAYDEMRRLIELNPDFEKLFVARGLRHPHPEVRWRKKR